MKRILLAIPLPYGTDWGYWTRDPSGLTALALRQMGYDAWLVALDSDQPLDDKPVIRASMEELGNAEWWKAQRPDGVVLNTWSAFRYDAIRRAARAATPQVLERLDTDGFRSARLFPAQLCLRNWGAYRDKLPPLLRWLAGPLAAGRVSFLYLFPALMDARVVATMHEVAGLIVESPIAGERIQKMMVAFSGKEQRIRVIPHPVDEDDITYVEVPKENRIITVGRWSASQKDFPMVLRVLKKFLQIHPDWTATVVGGGVPARYRSRATAGEEWERRVIYPDKLGHKELAKEYARSKIYLMASRHESFCIAAAEALYCGCSVVGSSAIPSASYFAETASGTVAPERTPQAFVEAMQQEVDAWAHGRRDPQAIAAIWRDRAGSHAVARATLEFLESIPAA